MMNKFAIKDSLDKILYIGFNVFSSVLFFFDFKAKRRIKKNESYRNIHEGQRCFIIGTGPSLNNIKYEEIDFLKKEITFGVNSLYKASKLDGVTPSYYAMFDNYYWNEYSYFFQEIKDKYRDKVIFLTNYKAEKIVLDLNDNLDHILLYSKKYPINKIDCDLTKNMDITMNVVSSTILAAIFMGFKEIYLLGCDYNSFASNNEVHCYEEEEIVIENRLGYLLKFYHITTEFHYLIAKLARKKGIKVINVTEGSLLDAYPRKQLNDIL